MKVAFTLNLFLIFYLYIKYIYIKEIKEMEKRIYFIRLGLPGAVMC